MAVYKITGPDTNDKVVHNVYPDGMPVDPNMMDPSIGGSLKKCKHVYETLGVDICPYCGRYTHETDWSYQIQLHKQWHADGKAVYEGWWSI